MVRLRQRSRFRRGGAERDPERPASSPAEDREGTRRVRIGRSTSLEKSRVRTRPLIGLLVLFTAVLAAILLLR